MQAALIQLTSGDDPQANLLRTLALVKEAIARGAGFVLTPEVTNIVSASRRIQQERTHREADDPTLAALRDTAAGAGIWLLAGSLALKSDDPSEDRLVNRSLLLAPDGTVAARYDKIHMFDVEIDATESYRESSGFAPGDRASLVRTGVGTIGLTVCYDLRFPHLYRNLAQAGAEILTVPSAFSPVTGRAHWEVLLRARAIETGAWILAPAQCGDHPVGRGRPRSTWGHSLAVAPWGEVIADGGTTPGITMVEIDLSQVASARARVPSLSHDRPFSGPGAG
ncbi:MAG: carbon-nitrogen hydrolase family protein [Rhodobacteraceae bacterium]|nr:carbon-nitrogen hydrolase family protein [Paracoccaceae bacterium]